MCIFKCCNSNISASILVFGKSIPMTVQNSLRLSIHDDVYWSTFFLLTPISILYACKSEVIDSLFNLY